MTTYKTIADLPLASAASSSDLLEISQSGSSRSVTVSQIVSQIGTAAGGRVFAATYGCSPGASGTTNRAAIQAALNVGGEVELPAGIIQLDNVTLVPRSNTNLYGNGNGTVLVRSVSSPNSYNIPMFEVKDVHDVTFDGVTLSFPLGMASRDFGIILRATSLNSTKVVRIRNCTFLNATNHIQRFVTEVYWTGNLFDGLGVSGGGSGFGTGGVMAVLPATTPDAGLDSSPAADGTVSKIFAIGNTFRNLRSEGIDINQDTAGVVIDGNSFIDCNLTGGTINEAIDIGGVNSMATGCRDIKVSNNNVSWTTATDSVGIRVKTYSQDVTLTGNTIYNATTTSGTAGILIGNFARNVTVTGNTVRGFRLSISLADANTGTCENINVIGNVADGGFSGGITVSLGTWQGVVIAGNTTTPLASASSAISMANVTRWVIEGNVIRGTGGSGILVATTATDGTIAGNNVSGSAVDGLNIQGTRINIAGNSAHLNGRIGINISAATHVNVTGNSAFNNSQVTANQYGINVAAGSNFCVITGNKVYDDQVTKTQNGIAFGVSDRVIFNTNVIWPIMTTATTGTAGLTNSLVGVTGNITA